MIIIGVHFTAYDKHSCAMHRYYMAYDNAVVQCIGIIWLMITQLCNALEVNGL